MRSIPPLLKNAIDWVSRVRQRRRASVQAVRRQGRWRSAPPRTAISPACAALNHLRAVLMHCQVEVITPQCSVPGGSEAFDEDGQFREERLRTQMETVCRTLIERAAMLSTRIEP